MSLRSHQIVEWNGPLVAGRATIRCNCGWIHTESTTDATLTAYRIHKSTN